jgi:hypothetical protein
MPQTITSIGDAAFYECTNITKLVFPDRVTYIDGGMFSECARLESVTLPKEMEDIFVGVSGKIPLENFTEFQIDESNVFFSTEDGVLFDKKKKTILWYPEGKKEKVYTIPNGVTTIGTSFRRVFSRCNNLEKLIFADTVTQINESTIGANSNLREVILNEGLLKIESYNFIRSNRLEEIVFPKSLLSIGTESFSNCASLRKITFLNEKSEGLDHCQPNVVKIPRSRDGRGCYYSRWSYKDWFQSISV